MGEQQNLMSCPEPLVLVDGDGPEREAARQRLESHARGCARCGPKLQALQSADQLLTRQLLGDLDAGSAGAPTTLPSGSCPEPEALAAWIDGDRSGSDLESHLGSCASCREDVLMARDLEGLSDPVPAVPDLQVSARPSRPVLLLWTVAAAAAAVLVAAGVGFILGSLSPAGMDGSGSSSGTQLSKGSEDPAAAREPAAGTESQVVVPPTETVVEPQIDPVVEPQIDPVVQPQTDPVVEPQIDPVVQPQIDPVVEPQIDPVVEPQIDPVVEPQIDPVVEPQPESGRGDSLDSPPVVPDPPLIPGLRVDVLASLGLQVQREGARGWGDVKAGLVLVSGDQIRASRSGGWVQVKAGDVYLGPQARVAVADTLVLDRGEVWLETTGRFVVSATAGEIEIHGNAFIQALGGKLKVLVHKGAALCRHRATGLQKKLGKGQSVSVNAAALGRVGQLNKLPATPRWASEFRARVKPEDPGKSGGGGTRGGGTRGRAGGGAGRQMRSRAAGAGGRR